MAHRNIKKFTIDGEFLEDSQIPLIRAQYEALLIHNARDQGYIPVLDLDSLWSTDYSAESDRWHFMLTVYTVYVGRKKSKQWEGWAAGKLISRHTQTAT